MKRLLAISALGTLLLLAACAPTAATSSDDVLFGECASPTPPTVLVVAFENTTGRRGDVHVTGMEDAATARLITQLKNSGCYDIVEESALLGILMDQGLESMDPVELGKAAGAGYVITGTVTRATIAQPKASVMGISLGAATSKVEVDVRATDIITGSVVVSMTGMGEATNPSLSLSRTPVGTVSFEDREVGPLFAEASNKAINDVVRAIQRKF